MDTTLSSTRSRVAFTTPPSRTSCTTDRTTVFACLRPLAPKTLRCKYLNAVGNEAQACYNEAQRRRRNNAALQIQCCQRRRQASHCVSTRRRNKRATDLQAWARGIAVRWRLVMVSMLVMCVYVAGIDIDVSYENGYLEPYPPITMLRKGGDSLLKNIFYDGCIEKEPAWDY